VLFKDGFVFGKNTKIVVIIHESPVIIIDFIERNTPEKQGRSN